MRFLLDSVILIDHFNNVAKATEFIRVHQNDIAISVITRAEVLAGFKLKRHITLAQQLFDKFEQFPLTIIEADLAAALRREYRWKLPDAIQAAIAKQHKLKLVTRNTKDFNPHQQDFVFIPYHLGNPN